MNEDIKQRYGRLVSYLSGLGPHAVAFSGGVDSTLLLFASRDATVRDKPSKNNALAITVSAPYTPEQDKTDAAAAAAEAGAEHMIIELDIPEKIAENPENRCYLCKQVIFSRIIETAKREGIDVIIDGTNFDDRNDYRPGRKALEELGVISPLLELAVTKEEVRRLAQYRGITCWGKQPSACLLTRLPMGKKVDPEELTRIDAAEEYIRGLGIDVIRVRSYGESARLEAGRDERSKLTSVALWDEITSELGRLGYRNVCLDLKGYTMGSMNEGLNHG